MEKIKRRRGSSIEYKYTDPFKPDLTSGKEVVCIHCCRVYKENEIWWNEEAELWVCKYWPRCDGAGFGFDIFYSDDAIAGCCK